MTVPVLIISGTVGAGKSAVLYECTDILEARGDPHAAIELDALSMIELHGAEDRERPGYEDRARAERHGIGFENLAAVWDNMFRRGARRLLIGAAVESRDHLARYEEAIPGASITVCLLTASPETIAKRLSAREVGSALDWHLDRSRALEVILRDAQLQDFVVPNDAEPVEYVAKKVLRLAGWIKDANTE